MSTFGRCRRCFHKAITINRQRFEPICISAFFVCQLSALFVTNKSPPTPFQTNESPFPYYNVGNSRNESGRDEYGNGRGNGTSECRTGRWRAKPFGKRTTTIVRISRDTAKNKKQRRKKTTLYLHNVLIIHVFAYNARGSRLFSLRGLSSDPKGLRASPIPFIRTCIYECVCVCAPKNKKSL